MVNQQGSDSHGGFQLKRFPIGLIDIESRSNRTFRKTPPNLNSLPAILVLYAICSMQEHLADSRDRQTEIPIETLLNGPFSPGRVYNLDSVGLLDKLYELSEGQGQIRIDGVNLRDIRTDHLRRNIGMVLQEPFLFSRSIAENIAIHDEEVSREQIREAARAACLDETVMGFAKGYDTLVGERGLTLSGGQKQRTAIARTLVRRTPILIFDDSLSAVDTETDAKIRSSLEARFGSATVILISHRITTLSKADRILVLDHGQIAEQGSHEELKTAGGLYQRICAIQSGIGEEAAE